MLLNSKNEFMYLRPCVCLLPAPTNTPNPLHTSLCHMSNSPTRPTSKQLITSLSAKCIIPPPPCTHTTAHNIPLSAICIIPPPPPRTHITAHNIPLSAICIIPPHSYTHHNSLHTFHCHTYNSLKPPPLLITYFSLSYIY